MKEIIQFCWNFSGTINLLSFLFLLNFSWLMTLLSNLNLWSRDRMNRYLQWKWTITKVKPITFTIRRLLSGNVFSEWCNSVILDRKLRKPSHPDNVTIINISWCCSGKIICFHQYLLVLIWLLITYNWISNSAVVSIYWIHWQNNAK